MAGHGRASARRSASFPFELCGGRRDEANLTSRLARPLIAATTGHDVPQPLVGDLALSAFAVRTVRTAADTLDSQLHPAVDG
ncbi:hypothetical protein [Streptomyces graminilatus]|uniref:hypothetical protein n=1 Tax=Streptomyces graminilatus TaxID=1464070 RepID=UPI0006E43F06|nr:hypothetical protein [Streptomyces graminilatus]